MTIPQPDAEDTTDNEHRQDESSPEHFIRGALSARQKLLTVFIASLATFVSPMSASIYYPSVDALRKDLHVSTAMINYTNTSFKVSPPIFLHGGVSILMANTALSRYRTHNHRKFV
jgi:hypothetical protein